MLIVVIIFVVLGGWLVFAIRKYLQSNKSHQTIEEKSKSLKIVNDWQKLGVVMILIGTGVSIVPSNTNIPFAIKFIFFIVGVILLIAANKDKQKLK